MFDVCIIGGGIIGGLVARELSRYKLKVCILEKENDVACGSVKANSAIVHAGFDAYPGTLKAKFNVEGSELMEEVAKELGVKYKRNGSLVIAFNEEEEETLKTLLERGVKNKVKNLKIISKKEVLELEPNISESVKSALYAPTGAIICPYELCISAIGNAMDNGVELKLNFCVDKIESKNDHYVIYSKEEKTEARYIVNAAGIFSDYIASLTNDNSFTVTPRKGEYILLDKQCSGLVSHTVFRTPSKMGKGILISPTVDNNIILGPTSENTTDKYDKSTTSIGLGKIINEEKENVKNLPLNKSITSFCGIRAVGSTGDFIIKRDGNIITLGGIESPGLSASPAIAKYVAKLLGEVCRLETKESFNPIRASKHFFKDLSIEEKNKIIKENPNYGKIVCRCENVTMGEIIDALTSNPKANDLDGIKRRTRAQMGRCQGGFCTPYIMDIIKEIKNCDYDDITKFGRASHITMGRTKGDNNNDK